MRGRYGADMSRHGMDETHVGSCNDDGSQKREDADGMCHSEKIVYVGTQIREVTEEMGISAGVIKLDPLGFRLGNE